MAPTGGTMMLFGGPLNVANIPLDSVGAPGCRLFLRMPFAVEPMMPTSPATALLTLNLPSDPVFINVPFQVQSVSFVPAINPLGVVFSDLGELRIGS